MEERGETGAHTDFSNLLLSQEPWAVRGVEAGDGSSGGTRGPRESGELGILYSPRCLCQM